MEAYSVGVQVPSLAPFPVRFLILGILVAAALSACAPAVEDAATECRAALERDRSAPDPAFLDLLTPASRDLVVRAAAGEEWPAWRRALMMTLGAAKPVDGEPGLLRHPGSGATLFFVRDGHRLRLDLVLSGATFLGMRQEEYPAPG